MSEIKNDNSATSLTNRSSSSKSVGNYKRYVDENGYTVIEYQTPTERLLLKYNQNHMFYSYNSEIRYDGPFDFESLNKAFKELDHSLDLLDQSLDQFDRKLEDFETSIDRFFDEDDSFERIFGRAFDPLYSPSRIEQSQSYYDTVGQNRHKNMRSSSNSSGNGCCLGCLIGTILIFAIICIVLYGMGYVGMQIIDFIRNLF